MKRTARMILMMLVAAGGLVTSCRNTEQCRASQSPYEIKKSSGVPNKTWTADYYSYRKGRYVFTKGHYSRIYFKKMYLKKTTKGYTIRREGAASGPRTSRP